MTAIPTPSAAWPTNAPAPAAGVVVVGVLRSIAHVVAFVAIQFPCAEDALPGDRWRGRRRQFGRGRGSGLRNGSHGPRGSLPCRYGRENQAERARGSAGNKQSRICNCHKSLIDTPQHLKVPGQTDKSSRPRKGSACGARNCLELSTRKTQGSKNKLHRLFRVARLRGGLPFGIATVQPEHSFLREADDSYGARLPA